MRQVRDKLHAAVITDRAATIENTLRVVKSDVYGILSQYMELDPSAISVAADLDNEGECTITVSAKTRTFYEIGKIIDT